jgi:hypothetical protein
MDEFADALHLEGDEKSAAEVRVAFAREVIGGYRSGGSLISSNWSERAMFRRWTSH